MTRARWFGLNEAFAHPVTVWIVIAIGAVLLLAILITFILRAVGLTSPSLHEELVKRIRSWAIMAPAFHCAILDRSGLDHPGRRDLEHRLLS